MHQIKINEEALEALHNAGASYAAKIQGDAYIINVDDHMYPRICALAPETVTDIERMSQAIIAITRHQFGNA